MAIDAFSTDPDVDRMLVVMNLYPLRARLPRNLAAVEDRMHELSFGNRLRQDHDNARRINALVETIDDLAALVSPDALDERLHARLDEARRYKVIDAIVNIDMQTRRPRSSRPRKTPLMTRMECAISPRKLYAAAAAMGSNSRTTSCGPRSKIAGARKRYPQVDRSGASRKTTKSHTPTAFFNYRATRSVFTRVARGQLSHAVN